MLLRKIDSIKTNFKSSEYEEKSVAIRSERIQDEKQKFSLTHFPLVKNSIFTSPPSSHQRIEQSKKKGNTLIWRVGIIGTFLYFGIQFQLLSSSRVDLVFYFETK